MANIVNSYLKDAFYFDNIKVGDIVTIVGSSYIQRLDQKEINKKYVVVEINKQEPCIGCHNYGYCMTLKERKLFSSAKYKGIACHYELGNKDGIRFKKRGQ